MRLHFFFFFLDLRDGEMEYLFFLGIRFLGGFGVWMCEDVYECETVIWDGCVVHFLRTLSGRDDGVICHFFTVTEK